jgi:hypothetical protein
METAGAAADSAQDGKAGMKSSIAAGAGNARLGGIAAIRSQAETEKYVREQFELYDKLATALGIRQ